MDIKENTGYLQPNRYHKKGDKQPCLKGSVNIAGIEYDVAMWAPKEGKKSYFAKFTKKDDDSNSQSGAESQYDTKNNQQPVQQLTHNDKPLEKKPSKLFK